MIRYMNIVIKEIIILLKELVKNSYFLIKLFVFINIYDILVIKIGEVYDSSIINNIFNYCSIIFTMFTKIGTTNR